MELQKEINSKFNQIEREEVKDVLESLDFARLKSDKEEIQKVLITLSDGNLESLKNFKRLVYKKEDDLINAAEIKSKELPRNLDDIKIGENKFIKWIPLGENYLGVYIDEYLTSLSEFWVALSTECVFGCCGIHACDFSKDNIQKASEKLNDDNLISKCKNFKNKVQLVDSKIIGSNILNQNINKEVFFRIGGTYRKEFDC